MATGSPAGRAMRAAVERAGKNVTSYALYFPTYPGRDEKLVTQVEQIENVLKELAATKPPGKVPTQPLCYGGWMPLGRDDDVEISMC